MNTVLAWGAVILVVLSAVAGILRAISQKVRAKNPKLADELDVPADLLDALVAAGHKHEHGEAVLQSALEVAESPSGQKILQDVLAIVRDRKAAGVPSAAGDGSAPAPATSSTGTSTTPPTAGGATS